MKNSITSVLLLLALLLPATTAGHDFEVLDIYNNYRSDAGTVEVASSPSDNRYSADVVPTFTGVGPFHVIEVTPEMSTGLDKIFVVYNTDEVEMNFTATTDEVTIWERFDYSSGQFQIEEITNITRTGNVTTLNHVNPNSGYRIIDGPNFYYYWVVNYADYPLELNDMSCGNEAPCDLVTFNIDGHADEIPYYTVNGKRQVLDRDIKLSYNTLVWDEELQGWMEQESVESFASLDQGVEVFPPLCGTVFELRGDRFLEEWGLETIIEGEYFEPQAVDCRSAVAENYDVLIDTTNGALIGSPPLRLLFTGHPTDAVANSVWEMATDPDFENVIVQFHQDNVDYTFNEESTYYMRYRVFNAAGTCEACGDTHIITIRKENYLQGDVNRDGEVNIADVNAVVDIVLGGGSNAAADVNVDGEIGVADVNAVIDVILGTQPVNDITGSWYSEYFVDEEGQYNVPESIAVGFDFYSDYTGRYSYRNKDGWAYTGLRWKQQGELLFIWYDDGDYERLFCKIDENGYLLMSLYSDYHNYTAYRPEGSASAALMGMNVAQDRNIPRQGNSGVVMKPVSRAIRVKAGV